MIAELDADEDGEVDPLDTNKDGFVSLAELEAAHSSLAIEDDGQMAGNSPLSGYAIQAYLAQLGMGTGTGASAYSVSGTASVNLTA